MATTQPIEAAVCSIDDGHEQVHERVNDHVQGLVTYLPGVVLRHNTQRVQSTAWIVLPLGVVMFLAWSTFSEHAWSFLIAVYLTVAESISVPRGVHRKSGAGLLLHDEALMSHSPPIT